MSGIKLIAVLESTSPCEKRVPIHPTHFPCIVEGGNKVFFQEGYGKDFESDLVIQSMPREQLLSLADILFILKPTVEDFSAIKPGATVVGWCHAVQNVELAMIAQQKKLTLISMEAMYSKNKDGEKQHLFFTNNYIAGMYGVRHALSLMPQGLSKQKKAAVICYGACGQGAAASLRSLGFSVITVFSQRTKDAIQHQIAGVNYRKFTIEQGRATIKTGNLLRQALLEHDIIVNTIKQNVLQPCHFFDAEDLKKVNHKMIIDISCDKKMGFDFAERTTIKEPIREIHHNYYYAVGNIPTLAWNIVTTSISEQLLPLLNAFITNKPGAAIQEIIEQATDIKNGRIINTVITEYQNQL